MARICTISSDRVASPKGHYAQGVVFQGLVFVSGQLPITLDGTVLRDQPFEAQAQCALENVFAILHSSGSNASSVLKVTAYIVGVDHWPSFDKVYAKMFAISRPARSVVPVAALHYGCLIEIDAIATQLGCSSGQ
jgi:reactive intermediate/imine deaminase